MLKHRRLAFIAAAVLALTASAANAKSPVTDGFLLLETDAAYARFEGPIDACHSLGLFVGFVEADRLLSPLGSGRPSVHSDLEAQLSISENGNEECGSDSLHLAGVRGLTETDQVEIVKLETATLTGFELTVVDDVEDPQATVMLTLTLNWIGDGNIYTETRHGLGDHTAHRTVDAEVDATVTIDNVDGGGELAAALADGPDVYSTVAGLVQTEGVITHYRQIVINLS